VNDVPVFHSVTKNSGIAGSSARQHTFSEQELSDVKMLKGCHQADSAFHSLSLPFSLSRHLFATPPGYASKVFRLLKVSLKILRDEIDFTNATI